MQAASASSTFKFEGSGLLRSGPPSYGSNTFALHMQGALTQQVCAHNIVAAILRNVIQHSYCGC